MCVRQGDEYERNNKQGWSERGGKPCAALIKRLVLPGSDTGLIGGSRAVQFYRSRVNSSSKGLRCYRKTASTKSNSVDTGSFHKDMEDPVICIQVFTHAPPLPASRGSRTSFNFTQLYMRASCAANARLATWCLTTSAVDFE